jgi:putative DNA primase/helicase
MEQGREMAEALAKNLTGGESITARHLYAECFDFVPRFKLWLALNHCPKVSADDGAIWRRILRIGFGRTVPPERRDKTLKPYLRNPTGGGMAFLAWCVEGCLRWQREGLVIPEAVKRSTEAYRTESDPLAAFVEDCLDFSDDRSWVLWADVWQAYCEHADENGTAERYRVAPKRLQEKLRGRGCVSERRHAGRGWQGVCLRGDWQTVPRDARDACDVISKTFSTKGNYTESLENGVTPVTPVTAESVTIAQLTQREGFIHEYR